eukprot:3692477-Rhodomonas_salina.2
MLTIVAAQVSRDSKMLIRNNFGRFVAAHVYHLHAASSRSHSLLPAPNSGPLSKACAREHLGASARARPCAVLGAEIRRRAVLRKRAEQDKMQALRGAIVEIDGKSLDELEVRAISLRAAWY